MRTLFLFTFVQLLSGCSYIYQQKSHQPQVVNGEIDLSLWDFEKDGPVWLEGEWAFFQGKIDPDQITANSIQNTAKFLGQRPDANDPAVPMFGLTTWAARMKLAPNSKELVFYSGPFFVAFNRFLKDSSGIHPIYEGSILTDQLETTRALLQHSMKKIEIKESEVNLFTYSATAKRWGPGGAFVVGTEKDILRLVILGWAERSFLLGCYALVAFVCLALYSQRRSERLYLYAGMVCSGMMVRYLGTEYVLSTLLPSLNPSFTGMLNFVGTMLALINLLLVLRYLNQKQSPSHFLNILLGVTLCILSLGIYFHLPWGNGHRIFLFTPGLLELFWFAITLLNLALCYPVIRTVSQIRSWSLYLGLGTGLYMLGIVWDVAVGISLLGSNLIFIAHYCNLALCICLTLMTGKRFAITYAENQKLLSDVKENERSRTVFFHNTSHELRTPLNGMIGFLQLLNQDRYGVIPDAARIQVEKCIRLALGLKNQVNTILDLAKSKKGMLSLSNTMFRLDDLAREAEDLAAGLRLKNQDCTFQLEKNWNTQSDQFVNDREKLGAIVRNVLGNAFKFSDPKRSNHVKLQLIRADGNLTILVSDTGIGIPPEQKDKVFEEFQQVAGDARRAYEGTGLGLAMVRDFVRLMGGTIELKSTVGEGTSFMIQVPEQKHIHLQQVLDMNPVSAARAESSALQQTQVELKPTHEVRTQGRLLVVDDNELNCELLRDLLTEEGFLVSVAMGGEEALRKMRSEHPDLVLLDMMMPFISGEDVIKEMQADAQLEDIPVILVTARASEDDRLFGLSLGADDYLAKPIHHEELLFRVKNLLHRLELNTKVASMEERDKLAQLGQLMRDLSHELKNVFQRDLRTREEEQQCGLTIIRNLPVKSPLWQEAGAAWVEDKLIGSTHVDIGALKFPSKELSQSRALRYLRASLAQLNLSPEQRLELWEQILSLSPEEQLACDQSIHMVRSFLVLQEQSQYASELIINILDYSRTAIDGESCELADSIPRVLKLIKPRLHKQAIRLELELKPWRLAIGSSQLMQVTLNLITNACDAIENLPKEERWIRIHCSEDEAHARIHFSNGGPALSSSKAASIFQESWSSKGNKGYGLGLAISQRLVQKVSGHLELNEKASHPEFVVTLPWAKIAEVRNVG